MLLQAALGSSPGDPWVAIPARSARATCRSSSADRLLSDRHRIYLPGHALEGCLCRVRGLRLPCHASRRPWREPEARCAGDRTLEDLHRLLQLAYDWDDDHLYAFWPSGKFWDPGRGAGFGRPGFCRESGDRSARIRLDHVGLEVGQTLAYLFDFGDEWRVRLKLVDVRQMDGAPATAIVESRGAAPPQYGWEEEDLGDAA